MQKENMFYGATPEIFEFAKRNRANPTPAEDLLWNYLCKNQLDGLRFKRQHPIGQYIADFYCHSVKLVIELDGSIHRLPQVFQNDLEKEDFIKANGLKILRFTNQEVFKNVNDILNKIRESANPPLGVRGMKLIECPRDAIQGIKHFIPTEKKIKYINLLLESNLFDTIDFGSFVSPKAIPQMADTAEVVRGLDLSQTQTKLLAIIANERGATEACQFEQISYLGYPFSISETFQLRNTNATIAESLERVKAIQEITEKADKQLVIYISMGFGNPYGDDWNAEIAIKWVDELQNLGIKIFSLSDTVGVATPESITYLFENLIPKYHHLEFGAHLHTTLDTWQEKVDAAYNAGCRRFDGAFMGYGGCPMAADELVGNMPMENLLPPPPKGEYNIEHFISAFQELIA
ncbi:MAG: DUF559 domain-containing protein [Emticicia sp.]|uniref:DUF559 domain-containing protein n=1 Tax=Emticicia sp. TaxID=1930953 RepID=UPI003BA497FE